MINRQTIARYIFAVIVIVTLFMACNPEDDRLLSYQHTVQVGLYSAHTKQDTTLINVTIWGAGVRDTSATKKDSVLYKYDEAGAFFLNLNMNADTTQFFIKSRTLVDKITFHYKRKLQPVSGAGGITMDMHIDTIFHTNQCIHSSKLVHKDIKYKEDRENVQLFIY